MLLKLLFCVTGVTILAAAQTGTLDTLYEFTLQEGGQPTAGVTIAPDGVLYGSTWRGGNIYTLTPPASGRGWTYTSLYTFPMLQVGNAGYSVSPNNVALDANGVVYSTNFSGGMIPCGHVSIGCGSVYSLTPPVAPGGSWTYTNIYTFTGGDDGGEPGGGVLVGPGGVLYGTTEVTGASGFGTVYSLTPPAFAGGTWTFATIHTFTGPPDGSVPESTLIMDANGVLYGTTSRGGGTSKSGTVFSLTPPASPGGAWTETVLYAFANAADGGSPNGGIVLGPGGVLYGSTMYAGASGGGVVYSLTPPVEPGGAWTEAVLHSFQKVGKVTQNAGPVVFGPNGALYGLTSQGGQYHEGSVFALTPPAPGSSEWGFLIIYSFEPPAGNEPYGGSWTSQVSLAAGSGGLLYGTTYFGGGSSNDGIVFSMRP